MCLITHNNSSDLFISIALGTYFFVCVKLYGFIGIIQQLETKHSIVSERNVEV